MLFSGNTTDIDQAYAILSNSYENIDAHHVELFNDGFDHAVFVVDGTQAFRFPKNEEYLQKIKVTAAFLQTFAPLSPIRVPNPALKEDKDLLYETYTFIEGVSLNEELARSWPYEKLSVIGSELGAFLTTLHTFPIEKAVDVPVRDPLEKWQKRYEAIQRYVFPVIDAHLVNKINSLFDEFFVSLATRPPKLTVIHADIKPAHIIVNETQQLSGIIDFGDMEIGDPAEDFTFFRRYTTDITPFALKAYTAMQDDNFKKRLSFYQDVLPAMELDHALEVGMLEKKNEYIQNLATQWG